MPEQSTELIINVTSEPKAVNAKIGNSKVVLKKTSDQAEFDNTDNVYYYNPAPELNRFSTPGSDAAKISIKKNAQLMIKIAKTDITRNSVALDVKGFCFEPSNNLL